MCTGFTLVSFYLHYQVTKQLSLVNLVPVAIRLQICQLRLKTPITHSLTHSLITRLIFRLSVLHFLTRPMQDTCINKYKAPKLLKTSSKTNSNIYTQVVNTCISSTRTIVISYFFTSGLAQIETVGTSLIARLLG